MLPGQDAEEVSREELLHYLTEPCPFPPGTLAKFRLMQLRADEGHPVQVPGDADLRDNDDDDEFVTPFAGSIRWWREWGVSLVWEHA